jgi:BASS family bile acid:Na+ symporter
MNFVTDVILPLALAFIMFTLGLGLSVSDFSNVFRKPKNFLIGLISQLIFLPIVGLTLVIIWPLPIEIAIGVMLIAAAPGGVTSNILTFFAKGDVALSVSSNCSNEFIKRGKCSNCSGHINWVDWRL